MLYLIDCDGVLADFTAHVIKTTGADITPEDVTSYRIEDHLGPEAVAAAEGHWDDPVWWATLPVIGGAREGIDNIRQAGNEVLIVTSPWPTCRGWYDARKSWLLQHFEIPYGDVLPIRRKELVAGDVLIDDKVEHVERWQAAHPEGRAFIYDQPYNREADLPFRITWADRLGTEAQ